MPAVRAIKPLGFPWQTQDPFLFCAYHLDHYPPGNGRLGPDPALLRGRALGQDFDPAGAWRMYHGQAIPGFPCHPHRGFETVTINMAGFVDHSDSLGALARFGPGDTQWMTAGSGIQHAEMFPLLRTDADNPLELFQVWLNLPRHNKLVEPHFKMLWRDQVPLLDNVDTQGRHTRIQLVAGTLEGRQAPPPTPHSWAADPDHEVLIVTVRMEAGAHWVLPAGHSEGLNRSVYFYRGAHLHLDGEQIDTGHIIELDARQPAAMQNGPEPAFMLILQGRPIREPVAQYGPFVMNTAEETRQAVLDYQRTQFGRWPWPGREHTHPQDRGRFAVHADGREETPG